MTVQGWKSFTFMSCGSEPMPQWRGRAACEAGVLRLGRDLPGCKPLDSFTRLYLKI